MSKESQKKGDNRLKALSVMAAAGSPALAMSSTMAQLTSDKRGGIISFGIESDQTNDLRFIYGQGYISVAAQYADSVHFPTTDGMWSDCNNAQDYADNWADIITDSTSISAGSHVLPFKKGASYGYFVVNVQPDHIIIRGHVMRAGGSDFECYEISTLGIEEKDLPSGNYTEYNYIGQTVDQSCKGLVIRVYESGAIVKTYK